MFVKAKKILASELMYAKGFDEDGATAWLDEELSAVGKSALAKLAETPCRAALLAPMQRPQSHR